MSNQTCMEITNFNYFRVTVSFLIKYKYMNGAKP